MSPEISSSRNTSPHLIVALDFNHKELCLNLVKQLDPNHCRVKIGKEMFTLFGPSLVEEIQKCGFEVFLDLKFHDIPNTVAKAVTAASHLGVWMVNVHASGGSRMMVAARESLDKSSHRPLLIGVTVLTSMTNGELKSVGVNRSVDEQVIALADLVLEAQLDGIVCSAQEVSAIKEATKHQLLCVTPGIRPTGSAVNDQRRTLSPREAIIAGSDYLVVGRPITQAENPVKVCEAITQQILEAKK